MDWLAKAFHLTKAGLKNLFAVANKTTKLDQTAAHTQSNPESQTKLVQLKSGIYISRALNLSISSSTGQAFRQIE